MNGSKIYLAKKKQKPVKSGGLKDADVGGTKRRRKTRAKAKKEIVTDNSIHVGDIAGRDITIGR